MRVPVRPWQAHTGLAICDGRSEFDLCPWSSRLDIRKCSSPIISEASASFHRLLYDSCLLTARSAFVDPIVKHPGHLCRLGVLATNHEGYVRVTSSV